jgi:hypothetical protein
MIYNINIGGEDMKKTIATSMDDAVIARVRAEAEKEERSVSQMLEILAREALDARDKAAK